MFGRQLNRKLLIAEPFRVDPILFILILIALDARLHPIMGKLLDLVVGLHFIRYNDYILYGLVYLNIIAVCSPATCSVTLSGTCCFASNL